jgi:hypothetical protein
MSCHRRRCRYQGGRTEGQTRRRHRKSSRERPLGGHDESQLKDTQLMRAQMGSRNWGSRSRTRGKGWRHFQLDGYGIHIASPSASAAPAASASARSGAFFVCLSYELPMNQSTVKKKSPTPHASKNDTLRKRDKNENSPF